MHLRAAAQQNGFTHNLRLEAAGHLVTSSAIQVDDDTGICSCSAMADLQKTVHFRPAEGFCTCHDRTLHGTCCHLLAAVQLPALAGVDLPAAVRQAEANGDAVSTTGARLQETSPPP